MESLSRTEAMTAYWRFIDDVSRGGSLIHDYTEWLNNEEPAFREKDLKNLIGRFPCVDYFYSFNVLDSKTGKSTTIRIDWEDLVSSIDTEVPAFDFYIGLLSDINALKVLSDIGYYYDSLWYARRIVDFRARFNENVQKILTYTMDQNDCRLADEILAVFEHNAVFNSLHTPKTRNILNAFGVWCRIYNTGSQADGQHRPEPSKAQSARETPPPLIEPNEQTHTKEKIETLFDYLKNKGCLDVYTRMEDWLYINGIQQVEGYTFHPIFWNGSRVDLVWLLCLMYPIPGAKPLKDIMDIKEVKAKKGIFDKANPVFLIKDSDGTLYPGTTGKRYKKPAKYTFSDTKRGQFRFDFVERQFTGEVQSILSFMN